MNAWICEYVSYGCVDMWAMNVLAMDMYAWILLLWMHGSMEAWMRECVSYGCVDVVTMDAWKHECVDVVAMNA